VFPPAHTKGSSTNTISVGDVLAQCTNFQLGLSWRLMSVKQRARNDRESQRCVDSMLHTFTAQLQNRMKSVKRQYNRACLHAYRHAYCIFLQLKLIALLKLYDVTSVEVLRKLLVAHEVLSLSLDC